MTVYNKNTDTYYDSEIIHIIYVMYTLLLTGFSFRNITDCVFWWERVII